MNWDLVHLVENWKRWISVKFNSRISYRMPVCAQRRFSIPKSRIIDQRVISTYHWSMINGHWSMIIEYWSLTIDQWIRSIVFVPYSLRIRIVSYLDSDFLVSIICSFPHHASQAAGWWAGCRSGCWPLGQFLFSKTQSLFLSPGKAGNPPQTSPDPNDCFEFHIWHLFIYDQPFDHEPVLGPLKRARSLSTL